MCLPGYYVPFHYKDVNAAMVLLNSVRTIVTVFGILSQCLWNSTAEKLCYDALNNSFNFEGEPNYLSKYYAISLYDFYNPKILESNDGLY